MTDTIEKTIEVISESERLSLELAKMNRKLASTNAELALAKSELAELGFRYQVLQLYRKYGLADTDGLNEQGQIMRNYVEAPGDDNGTK
jgi:hypothetical protein